RRPEEAATWHELRGTNHRRREGPRDGCTVRRDATGGDVRERERRRVGAFVRLTRVRAIEEHGDREQRRQQEQSLRTQRLGLHVVSSLARPVEERAPPYSASRRNTRALRCRRGLRNAITVLRALKARRVSTLG